MRWRIEARAVWTGVQGAWYAPGQVTWTEAGIESAGAPEPSSAPVDRVIRVPEGVVLPGLLNAHNHAAMALLRGLADDSALEPWLYRHIFPVEAKMTAEDVWVGTLLACAEMIRGGTVGFADMYFHADAVARAVEQSGMRAWIAPGLVEADDPGRERLLAAVAFAQRWRDRAAGRIVGMLGPHAPYTCGPDYLEAVAEAAVLHRLGVHIHLAESPREVETIRERYGLSPVALAERVGLFSARVVVAHAVHLDDRDRAILAGIRGGVAHCPVSNAKLGNGIADVPALLRQGVAVGLGTDGPASTNALDLFLEMKTMAWLQKVRGADPTALGAREALAAATSGSAAVLGGVSGQLLPGHPADLCVVSTASPHWTPVHDWDSNVVYATCAQDVRYVVCAGRMLLEDGRLTTIDEAAVRQEAAERARHLVGER
ncbi:MAG: amidohydrolase [Firmicutes bacterium]|nr:amidohydrolase [Alicyclobacillaceae bacterium]MCL6496786.1 amidohydrolase [Bacillota bacterium]